MTTEILRLEHVSKSFSDGDSTITILKDISFSLKRGEFIAIVGPSGSGKSTLLAIIGALLSPTSGKVIIDDQNIAEFKSRQLTSIRKNKVGFIFQFANLIPYLTVEDQLMLIGNLSKGNKKEYAKRGMELIRHLGLSHRIDSYPNNLSGGEKQRVAIARAFMNDPDIVLADEPTASLDSERGKQVVDMIRHEVKGRNKAAIMVTHDERMLHACDRILHIEDGRLFE